MNLKVDKHQVLFRTVTIRVEHFRVPQICKSKTPNTKKVLFLVPGKVQFRVFLINVKPSGRQWIKLRNRNPLQKSLLTPFLNYMREKSAARPWVDTCCQMQFLKAFFQQKKVCLLVEWKSIENSDKLFLWYIRNWTRASIKLPQKFTLWVSEPNGKNKMR